MATYNGNMAPSGTLANGSSGYNSTAAGYQIGGSDQGSAYAQITLPTTYSDYANCHITCTFYSSTAPSKWLSTWECDLGIYKNGKLYGLGSLATITKEHIADGSGASSRALTVNLNNGYFEAGDVVKIALYGESGTFVDSSDRCVYLRSATFTSENATNTLYLSFNANGGSGAPGTMSAETDGSGYAYFTVPGTTPTRSGYMFLGWSTSSSASSATYEAGDTVRLNVSDTLYAVWRLITYGVTYDDNGADSGAAPTDNTAYSSGATVAVAGPGSMVKEGYIFAGWNTEPDGSGTTYAAGATFSITGAVTLYAIWVEENKAYIYDGTTWQKARAYVYDGTTWREAKMCLFTTEWNS